MTATATYYCIVCGKAKDAASLQPSTDAKDRYRLGVCPHTGTDSKGNRRLSTFALTYRSPQKWGHGDGATQYCPECGDVGGECSDPKPAPGSMLCYCGHTIQKK